MTEAASIVTSEHSFFGDEQNKLENEQNKTQFDYSKNSSNQEGIFDALNKEIRHVVENGKDLSYYSNSNSKISEQQQYNDQFLDSRYWCSRKNNNENDYLNGKNEKNEKKNNLKNEINKNDNNNKKENDYEEQIIYLNNEDEKNNFNDDFDEEDMEEKTLEKRENGINEINSIKVNNNNLNNKNSDNLNNNNQILNSNNNIFNKSKTFTEQDEKFLIINEKLNPNLTPNKINQPVFPCIYKNQQVHSFVSTYNNYPSTFSKGSFISTNNSSNNKYKKDEDYCSSEIEEEIHINNHTANINNEEMKNNNNLYNHGNKFGPHLNNYNQLSNNNITMDTANMANINNLNNITNFNMNSNFLYNRIPKMNLNMVYYIPVQQQPLSTNTNYINNNKLFSNLNSMIPENNANSLNSKNNKTKENYTIQNNANNNNKNINDNKTSNNSSSEEKNKNKLNNSAIKNINNSNNNYRNSINNNSNYKNNSYRKNDTNNNNSVNSSLNSNANNNSTNNIQYNKGEKNLLNLDDILSGKDTRTTVMIRNIPIKYTEDILIEALDEFKGKYDCLYMPFDYEKKGNKGYAFINFVNPLHILYFHEKFDGKKWPLFESSKICELNSANFQGIYEIQKHSKNYKGYKKPLFYSEQNNNENIIIPSKYLGKLKVRFPNMKFHENKGKKNIVIDSFE
jgi:hypothetical protein